MTRTLQIALFLFGALLFTLGCLMALSAASGCTPAERAAVAADLPAIERGTQVVCAIVEGSTATTAAGPAVDMACSGTEGLEAVVGAVLAAAPSVTVATVTDAGADAGAVIMLHRVPVSVASLFVQCRGGVALADAGGG